MFHDVGWPHARRDTYYAPERIPEEHRQPLGRRRRLAPGNAGLHGPACPTPGRGPRGRPRNGVLTAIEDFVEPSGLRLAIVPAFFGFGVLWRGTPPGRTRSRGRGAVRPQPDPGAPRGQPRRPRDRPSFASASYDLLTRRARALRRSCCARSSPAGFATPIFSPRRGGDADELTPRGRTTRHCIVEGRAARAGPVEMSPRGALASRLQRPLGHRSGR